MFKPLTNLQTLLSAFDICAPAIELEDMVLDSREVAIHKLFVAIAGHQLDGRDFIPQAISLGAKAILAETLEPKEHGSIEMREQTVIVHFYDLKQQLSRIAAEFFSRPAESLHTVAVTGTNGKTSVTQLIAQLTQVDGELAGTIGTLGAGIGSDLRALKNTTPDAISMQRLISTMADQKAKLVAYEASSHALVQGRLSQVQTDVAVFTNLTRDHLDYHGDMVSYAAAKRQLLNLPGIQFAVLNQDDGESENWLSDSIAKGIIPVFFGLDKLKRPEHKYVIATSVKYQNNGVAIDLDTSWGKASVQSPLLGQFNVLNLLAALACQFALGGDFQTTVAKVATLKPVPGRMDLFYRPGKPALVVDYAHTPDALEQSLKAVKMHTRGDLYCIFGCGGDRDKGKRPMMAQAAESGAQHIIVTNDNSRSEDPNSIASEIIAGLQHPQLAHIELDRRNAIRFALSKAKPEDMILIAGKGHESEQIIGDKSIYYNEREFVAALIEEV